MNVKSVEKLEKSQVAVTVEVTAEEFEAAVQKAYLKMRNKISVPGFRPGKAPRKMIEKLYGEGVFYSDAVDAALPEAYTQAIGSSGLDVVGYPEVEIVDDQIGKDGFTFKATVAVYPEVELGQYKGVSAVKEEVKVTADDVKERLNQMAEREARLVSVDRKVKKGDTAVIDFEGFDNGVAFEGGKGEDYPLTIGSDAFIPGFEDQLIGAEKGAEVEVKVQFPAEYHAEDLAGKPAVFKVTVKEIKAKELPALDDDFAQDVSEFNTLEEYKADVRKKLEEKKEAAAKEAKEEAAIAKAIENAQMDIPEAMIDTQTRQMMDEFASRLQQQGLALQQYYQFTGMDNDKLAEQMKPNALKRIQTRLVLEAVVKAEDIKATEEEYKAEVEKLAKMYQMETEKLEQLIGEAEAETMKEDIAVQKAADLIRDTAKEV